VSDLQRALEIAVAAHKGQMRKNGEAYVLHPLRMMLRMECDSARIVALLHDVVENSAWTLEELRREGFSKEVVEALRLLTRSEDMAYRRYIERVAEDPLARRVKLADLEDNMDLDQLPRVRKKDFDRVRKYHRAWRRLHGSDGPEPE
jgi:(p)ppGpp synthase/HD superfamily hydrolase